MTAGNVTSLAGCLKCPANFFCVDAVTKELCPTGTYSNPGAMDKHDCQCLDQYECAYSTVTTKKVSLAVTPEEFEARRAEFIATLAAAWGVSADSIKIVSVQSSSSQTLRRVLRPGIVQGSAGNSRLRQTTVTIVVKIKRDSTEADITASKILRERGLPALAHDVLALHLDFVPKPESHAMNTPPSTPDCKKNIATPEATGEGQAGKRGRETPKTPKTPSDQPVSPPRKTPGGVVRPTTVSRPKNLFHPAGHIREPQED